MAERPPSPFQWMRALLRPRPVVPPATAPAPAADGVVPAGHYYSPIPSAADILFGSDMVSCYPEWFRADVPHCLTNPGGAFWMERVR